MTTPTNHVSLIEDAIRVDPGNRGLLDSKYDPLGRGELARAADSLAKSDGPVWITTGFFIPAAEPPAAETDGPPGAVALATVLENLGTEASIVTDHYCAGAVRAAIRAGGLDDQRLRIVGSPNDFHEQIANASSMPSHLIAIERLGPTYDGKTIEGRWGGEVAPDFHTRVPPSQWSRMLNMRGMPLDEWTVDLSGPFENPPPGVVTIGIGDGGNEIGMGKFRWQDLVSRLPEISPPGILTRVACDHTIIAGTSNWGAIGLAAAVALTRNSPQAFAAITPQSQQSILESMIQTGPAVDGVTRRFEATVDGLARDAYFEPLRDIRRILDFESY